jgi:hypothetical protein
MLLAPERRWGFRCPHDFDNVKIMSFDFQQHPMERVRLSTQMQRTAPCCSANGVGFFGASTVLPKILAKIPAKIPAKVPPEKIAGGIARCHASSFGIDAGCRLSISGRIEISGNKNV